MNTVIGTNRITSRNQRQGGIYVAVLGVSMIVAVIAMTSLQLARLEIHAGVAHEEMTRAQLAAQSCIELALARIETYSTWRTDSDHGEDVPNVTGFDLGGMAKHKYQLLDDDTVLSDNSLDNVTIQALGIANKSTSVVTVRIMPSGAGLTCLENSLHSGSDLQLSDTNSCIVTDQMVGSNTLVEGTLSTKGITGDAWSGGLINGIVSGTRNTNQTPLKVMPNTPDVFEYYIKNGTNMTVSDTGSIIDKVLLSPDSNPYGAETNPEGIYVIDCQNTDMKICDCRILGTLVLLNAGSGSGIAKSVLLESAVTNYPVLMVQGDLEMDWRIDQDLVEDDVNVNFNPVGSPYEGSEDSDQLDSYTPLIKGLVYVSGSLLVSREANLNGVVVVGETTTIESDLNLTYDPTFLSNPPPGFRDGTAMQIIPSTWQRAGL